MQLVFSIFTNRQLLLRIEAIVAGAYFIYYPIKLIRKIKSINRLQRGVKMGHNPLNNPFQEQITTEEELRDLLGKPGELAARKVISILDEHCRQFIERTPLAILSTSNAQGHCDASPRGDAPGFIQVLDEKHLIIPERPGNRRTDSMRNILANPQVGLLLIIPGLEETLRINGQACLVRDSALLEKMAVNGRVPLIGIGVKVEECFIHCAKAFMRSGLWDSKTWLPADQLPSPAQMIVAHTRIPGITVDEVSAQLQESYTKRLY